MKTTKCKTCGSTDITVTVTVNPNSPEQIVDYCHRDDTITEDGWCNECSEYAELETVDDSEPESDAPSILNRAPLYLKRHRKEDGSFTDWYAVDRLPGDWPEGATTNFYHNTENKLYLVPDDSARYYEIADGALCIHCKRQIDKAAYLHAESRKDRRSNLCIRCWGDINHGITDLPVLEDDQPMYRLRNTPLG